MELELELTFYDFQDLLLKYNYAVISEEVFNKMGIYPGEFVKIKMESGVELIVQVWNGVEIKGSQEIVIHQKFQELKEFKNIKKVQIFQIKNNAQSKKILILEFKFNLFFRFKLHQFKLKKKFIGDMLNFVYSMNQQTLNQFL